LKDFRLVVSNRKSSQGCPVRNAAESFFFANFLFCGKKESGEPFAAKKESERALFVKFV